MSVERQLLMSAGGGVTQYTIPKSLRFRSSASAYLSRTFGTPTNNKIWTYSFLVKRGTLGAEQELLNANTNSSQFYFSSTDTLNFYDATSGAAYYSSQVFRDPSAWYNILVSVDTTQATAANRVKIYVNGTQITAFSTGTAPTQNNASAFNVASTIHVIGRYNPTTVNYFDGYMAEVNFIDGQALTPSSFGETSSTTGVWIPKRYSGSYGTNGFYLTFNNITSTTTLGYDTSGNSNNWTPNNLSLTTGATYDSMLDSPTNYDNGGNGVGNYAVLNRLFSGAAGLSYANLRVSGIYACLSSIQVPLSGKWYIEANCTSVSVGFGFVFGLRNSADTINGYIRAASNKAGVTGAGTVTYNSYANFANGDIASIAYDADSGTINFYKNNVLAATITSFPATNNLYFTYSGDAAGDIMDLNFGQRPFAYTPPTGYKALNTQNIPTPSIVNGAAQFAATTYTGTGSSLSISGAAFQPDLVWIKSRSAATDNKLTDVIRGTTNALISNSTVAATTDAGGVTAFNSNGFTVGTTAAYNTNAATYIAWQWKANGTAVSNTAGSITSQVSANTTAGFSVVTYTGNGTSGATIGHGLGVAPAFMIVKSRSSVTNWYVYSASLPGPTYYLALNATDAQSNTNGSTLWNSTAPTSSLITLGNSISTNASATNYLIYAFTAISGYSAFGSYTGNGSADGPFVYCGFRPKLVMVKRTDTTGSWYIYDTTRDTYNVEQLYLLPDSSGAEGSASFADGLSNGFKLRQTSAGFNASGGTYIYAAFAENPFKNALAR